MQDLAAIKATLASLQAQIAALQGEQSGESSEPDGLGLVPIKNNYRFLKVAALDDIEGVLHESTEDGKTYSHPLHTAVRGYLYQISFKKFEGDPSARGWKSQDKWAVSYALKCGSKIYVLQTSLGVQASTSLANSLFQKFAQDGGFSQPITIIPKKGEQKVVWLSIEGESFIPNDQRQDDDALLPLLPAELLRPDPKHGFPWGNEAAPQPPAQAPFQGVPQQQPVQNLPPAPEGFNGQGWLLFQKSHLEGQFGVKIDPSIIKGMIENTYGYGTKSESLTWEQANVIYQSMAALAQNMAQQAIPNPEAIANAPQAPRPQPTSHDGRSID